MGYSLYGEEKMNSDIRNKLIWKYFWKRKREEVYAWFKEWAGVLLFIQIILLFITSAYFGLTIEGTDPLNLELSLLLLFISIIEIIIIAVYEIIYRMNKWLCSNWRLATEDADIELMARSRLKKK